MYERGDMDVGGVPTSAVAARDSIEDALRAARELLGMDISWVAEFRDGMHVFRKIEGDGDSFGFAEGKEVPLDATYCDRVVRGVVPSLIPDADAEPGLDDLRDADSRIGAYVSVPIEVGGSLYGTLCCASARPNGALTERDVDFLRALSRRVGSSLETLRHRTDG